MKKPYIRIDFIHCGLDYNYTIVETWSEMKHQLDAAEFDISETDPKEWKEFGKPEIKISVVELTEEEFNDHFDKWEK